jgi:phosphatidylinositol 4-kinase
VFSNPLEVEESAMSFSALCEAWILHALKTCPREALPIIESYVAEFNASSWLGSPSSSVTGKQSRLLSLCQKIFTIEEYSAPLIKFSVTKARFVGEIRGMLLALESGDDGLSRSDAVKKISNQCAKTLKRLYKDPTAPYFTNLLCESLFRASALIVQSDHTEIELLQLVCNAPAIFFDAVVVESTMEILGWIMATKPSVGTVILARLLQVWESAARKKVGIYASQTVSLNPFDRVMKYGAPVHVPEKDPGFKAHKIWVRFLSDRFQYDRLQNLDCLLRYASFVMAAFSPQYKLGSSSRSLHVQLSLADLGCKVAKELTRRRDPSALFLWQVVLKAVIKMFANPPELGNVGKAELYDAVNFYKTLTEIEVDAISQIVTNPLLRSAFSTRNDNDRNDLSDIKQLAIFLMESRIHSYACWVFPLGPETGGYGVDLPPPINERMVKWSVIVKTAWLVDPKVAVHLIDRFPNSTEAIESEILDCAKGSEIKVVDCAAASLIFLRNANKNRMDSQLRHLMYWTPVNPVLSIDIMYQGKKLHPWVLQYAFRSLEHYPVNLVFFYIPQLVQALRKDEYGYVEKFILEAAKTSQYFAHQIIWNMEANKFKDENCEVVIPFDSARFFEARP